MGPAMTAAMHYVNIAMPYIILPTGLLLLVLCILHAWKMFSLKSSLKMMLIGYVVAYILEEIGVHTGLIFGHYHFTRLMGPKIDVIPIALVCLWVTLLYIAFIVTNLLIDGSPLPKRYDVKHLVFTSAVAALLVTTLDIEADPFATLNGWWVWEDGGSYFGVPYHNFVGWFFVGFCTYMVHVFQLHRDEQYGEIHVGTLECAPKWVRILSIAPLLVYWVAGIAFMLIDLEGVLGLVSVYALILPAIVATYKWFKWYQSTEVMDDYALPTTYAYIFDPLYDGEEETEEEA